MTKDGKVTAQCPACAQEGGDSKGVHLVVYSGGAFSCSKYPNDKKHNAKILRLVGLNGNATSSFSVNPVANEPPKELISAEKIKLHLHCYAGNGGTAGTPESG